MRLPMIPKEIIAWVRLLQATSGLVNLTGCRSHWNFKTTTKKKKSSFQEFERVSFRITERDEAKDTIFG